MSTEPIELHVNALLTEQGVSMGDHGQDVTKAVVLDLDMTVRELCEKHLTKEIWVGLKEPMRVEPNTDKYMVIRLAEVSK